ncbi:hypothetical protein B0H14DRAFT_3718611 [Mycena olivaceomarginata]|nr:hypothetical protein B0H14DRAFT_3718611 [Mycena olivaceomarginata]
MHHRHQFGIVLSASTTLHFTFSLYKWLSRSHQILARTTQGSLRRLVQARSFTTNPKHHTRLRPSSAFFPPKIPPTWTLSLASVTADLTVSLEFPATTNFPFSAAPLLCVPVPIDTGDALCCGDLGPAPEAWRPPRVNRVSSRRAMPTRRSRVRQASVLLHAFCSRFHFKRCWIYVIVCVNRRQPPPSIASNLSHHADDPNSLLSDLE